MPAHTTQNPVVTQTNLLLDRALELAAQGIPVFPCMSEPGNKAVDKAPACKGGFKSATTDRDTIRALFAHPRAELIGVPTGPASGWDVLDLDPRNGSDPWRLENSGRLPATRIHATRSPGGLHLVFRHKPGLRNSTERIHPGVDVKAEGGYVIYWPGFGGEAWFDDEPIAPWPQWILDQLAAAGSGPQQGAQTDKLTEQQREELTPPHAKAVVELLHKLPNTLETSRHEYTRVMLAASGCARLTDDPEGDIGEAAADWAERWEGGDGRDERARWADDFAGRPVKTGWPHLLKIARQLIPGFVDDYAAPEFEPVAGEAPPLPEPPAPTRFTFGPAYVPRDPSAIPPREWLYGGHYIRQFITATVAPGGVGKSSLALIEALDMATGRGLLTGKPAPVKHRVIYWNGEDPLVETERRVAAACLHFGITAEELGDRLVIASGRDLPIVIARDTRDGCDIAKPLVEELIAELTGRGIDALILDPFVKSHAVSENDNNKIDAVASQWAAIADRANCSIELIHHLRKASVQGQDRTAEDARGGVALIAAARSVRVLNRMGAEEATKLGIPDETRRRLFRVDDGKANLQPPRGTGDDATWRYQVSVSLGNARPGLEEDRVGVVTAWVKPEAADVATPERVAEIVRRLHDGAPNRADSQSPMWVGHWLAGVLGMPLADGGDKKRVGAVIADLVLRGVLKRDTALDQKREMKAVIVPAEPLPHLENEGCGKVRQGAAKQANQSPPTPPSMGCGGVVRQGGDSAAPYEGGVRQLEDAETNALAEELAALLKADVEAAP